MYAYIIYIYNYIYVSMGIAGAQVKLDSTKNVKGHIAICIYNIHTQYKDNAHTHIYIYIYIIDESSKATK